MNPTDAKTYWANLIKNEPRLALALAKTAPVVAPPWGAPFLVMATGAVRPKPTWPPEFFATALRPLLSFDEGHFAATVVGKHLGYFKNLKEAKAACDAKLRELGYLLED